MIKALFFDVDGTLVSFNTHDVPESTREALRLAHESGVKIFTATIHYLYVRCHVYVR